MAMKLACGDVMPGCSTVVTGESEDEVLSKAGQHAAQDHGVTEMDDATLAQVRGAIQPI